MCCRNSLVGNIPKFPVLCLQQDCGQGGSCSCSVPSLQRGTRGTACCSPALGCCDKPWQRGNSFQGLDGNHQQLSLLSSPPGALHKPEYSTASTRWAVPPGRNAAHCAERLQGEKGSGSASSTPLRGLKTQQLPATDTGPPAASAP